MSGYTASRLYLALGWLAVVGGIGWYVPAVAVIIGGIGLIAYGLFAVDVTKPGKKPEPAPSRNGSTLRRTDLGAAGGRR